MPRNSLEEKFCSLEFYTESKWCVMADQLLWRAYSYRLYDLSAFSNQHAVLRKPQVWQKKRKFGTVVNISLT